jgi:hypothetical protein
VCECRYGRRGEVVGARLKAMLAAYARIYPADRWIRNFDEESCGTINALARPFPIAGILKCKHMGKREGVGWSDAQS